MENLSDGGMNKDQGSRIKGDCPRLPETGWFR
jgi:hypothetical protein